MILTIFLPALERVLNKALRCDPSALEKLASIQNQIIRVDCTDWKFSFYIVADANGLQFYEKYYSQENTTVKATLNDFLCVFVKGASPKTFLEHPLTISGASHNLEVLKETFEQLDLDLDLEEKLSSIVGDVIAYRLFSRIRKTKKIIEKTSDRFVEQIKEYVFFEGNYFPTRKKIEKFYEEIAVLQQDVERLEARLSHTQHQV